ncbi:TIGR03560 family F420-dependent LLM class oxidoreductase [Parafrankia discariae]|uniref:TIGR03560 family F420-dependent LLM class oxidoreductase n=1 Tax=Parafrankia discariae TaxID=365528 RepID=UPI00037C1361|nr:TIGR03560 family F420-dependent LLM class oxidoreductase [Parafrankia discariae]
MTAAPAVTPPAGGADTAGRRPFRLGLQIPRLPAVPPHRLFERLVETATTAARAGFDALFVMDHFHQISIMGPAHAPMLDSYTLLAALAARTRDVGLGALVTGVTYRNPAHLAKIVTSLDVVSGGRALLGIGAGWNREEQLAYGYPDVTLNERYALLEDALRIARAMFGTSPATVPGDAASIHQALNEPQPLQPGGPMIMIGGGDERRTLRLVAQYADATNLLATVTDIRRKLDALDAHCADLRRDPASVHRTWVGTVVTGVDRREAERHAGALPVLRGVPDLPAVLADQGSRDRVRLLWGSPDQLAEQSARIRGLGLGGLIVNMPAHPDRLDLIEAVGAALAPVWKTS